MQTKKELGKIRSVKIGSGGYQDACFGISFSLGNDSWGVSDFWGTWGSRTTVAQYSEEAWRNSHVEAYLKLQNLMEEAKVKCSNKLVGIPVEVLFEDGRLKSWRILNEVL